MKPYRLTRRRFVQGVAAATLVGPLVSSRASAARRLANSQVNIACIGAGVGGKGESDMLETSAGHNIVAICDIDEQRLAASAAKFPKAKTYTDYRKLLEQPGIDAVTISTPDHMHAPITMAAMRLGKHVFTQKPLTHSVSEARQLAKLAAENKLVTQMGIQHHATARLKMAVAAVQSGAIGKVSHVHAWTDRPGNFWKQGLERPDRADKPPAHVHWEEWLGVAPERPFVDGLYHPFHWRGWWDFGTGALGDMGCHILDPVVNALSSRRR
jgi:predicted dehydrogenase